MIRLVLLTLLVAHSFWIEACSMLYFVDSSGHVMVVNNEDYRFDVDAYIEINPASKNNYARLWYGWDQFAQGGINSAGLVFDGAVTPPQETPRGYGPPSGNLGDQLLASCASVEEALLYLEKHNIALSSAHMMIGDNTGHAVVVEWLDGQRKVIENDRKPLIATNFLLSDSTRGNYPCRRYASIAEKLSAFYASEQEPSLHTIGNLIAGASQAPITLDDGTKGGTLYTTFIDLTEGTFVLSYQLSNENIVKLNLKSVWNEKRKRKIQLSDFDDK